MADVITCQGARTRTAERVVPDPAVDQTVEPRGQDPAVDETAQLRRTN